MTDECRRNQKSRKQWLHYTIRLPSLSNTFMLSSRCLAFTVSRSKILLMIESKMLKKRACQKVATSKAGFNIHAAISIIKALMTNKNKPNEIIVAGIVKKTRIGLIDTFNKESSAANITAYPKLSRYTPGKI